MKLKNKIALVTGGSRGIGAGIVRKLAEEGATVAFTYVGSEKFAEEIVNEIKAKDGRALAILADSSDPKAVTDAVDQVAKTFGGLDILVNSAGISKGGMIEDLSLDDFDLTYKINVRAVFVAIQSALKHMKAGGRIINIGSNTVKFFSFPGASAYVMSKAAVAGLTSSIARDLGPRGITINTVHPGPTATDMNPDGTEFATTVKQLMPFKQYGKPEEIGSVVAFLASPDASFVNGTSIVVDGGQTA